MKKVWMMLALGLIWGSSIAAAAEVKVDLHIPDVDIEGLLGNDNVVALWVESVRKDGRIGKDLEGANVMLNQDAAASVMAAVSTSLRMAGFQLVPYRADAPLALMITLKSLDYSSEKSMVSSKARVSASMHAIVSRLGEKVAEKTLGASGEYVVAWRPSKDKIGQVVSETLADNVRAVLQDPEMNAALKGISQE